MDIRSWFGQKAPDNGPGLHHFGLLPVCLAFPVRLAPCVAGPSVLAEWHRYETESAPPAQQAGLLKQMEEGTSSVQVRCGPLPGAEWQSHMRFCRLDRIDVHLAPFVGWYRACASCCAGLPEQSHSWRQGAGDLSRVQHVRDAYWLSNVP